MLKKVTLTNVHTGRVVNMLVDTFSDERALLGSGQTTNETAQVSSITGIDERIQRLTSPGLPMGDRVNFFNGLAKCFERNIPTVKSFQLQTNRMKSPIWRGVIADLCEEISKGEKISECMAKHPRVFDTEVLALVRAGEESGQLPRVFRQLAVGQKKTMAIMRKLRGGMIYPAIVMTLGLAVIIVMSFTLVPAMVKLYASLDTELPLPTMILMKFSDNLLKRPYLVAIPIFALVALFKNFKRITRIPRMQRILIKLPILGNIVRMAAATVSFRTLSMLVDANVRLSTALDITAEAASHLYYKEFFTRVKKHIGDGQSIQESFMVESHWLGDDGRNICGVMEVAGETGSGTEPLNEIADDYEEELDQVASQIDKVIEPVTIMILGVMVGCLVYAIYGPIFSLGDTLLPKK
ncbi:MAG: type II secretion system F family protein [Verrucomicrobiales bacterium]